MNKRSISLLIFCLVLFACSVQEKRIAGIILPSSSITWRDAKTWRLTIEDINEAEPIITSYIKKQNYKIYSNLHNYRCQYFGIYNEGKKRIFCNFFHIEENIQDWKINPVLVFDGGDRYFSLEYDVESKKCLYFEVNGEA